MKLRYLILPMMLAGVLSAQPRGFRGGASLTPPTASELLTREVDFLTKYFTLTTTQVGQVTAIVSYEQQTCLPPSATLQAARQGLVTAIKSGISARHYRGDRRTLTVAGRSRSLPGECSGGHLCDFDRTAASETGKRPRHTAGWRRPHGSAARTLALAVALKIRRR